MVTIHERPGVYSVYEASAVVSSAARKGVAAIAARSGGGIPGELYDLGSLAQAAEAFGKEDRLTELVRLLMVNGAARVLAVPLASDSGYEAAFALLNSQEGVKVVLCDSEDLTVQQALRDSVEEAADNRRERIAVVCGGSGETVSQLTARAGSLNSQRVALAAPPSTAEENAGVQVAAAVAGAICADSDPALPLGGAVLRGLPGLAVQYGESDIDALIQGGVIPLESAGGRISVIRGVTTRTKTAGVADATWRELTTIRIVDDVIPGIREALAARFTRSKNTRQVRGAIRSQVILELERKKAAEIITDYGEVTAEPLADNPTVCLVTFDFSLVHGLNQIWISAQITV